MATHEPVPEIGSARLQRLPPYLFGRINAMKHKMRTEGRDVIDLGMGNPSDATPKVIVDKLCEAVRDKRNQRYSVSVGVFNLRREVARHYQERWGVQLDPENEVVACLGSKEAFSHLCLALLGPGDTALVPTPAFPIHLYGVVLAGANAIGVPMGESDEELLSSIARMCEHLYPRPKVLILNYPHNPTTRCVEEGFFVEVVKLARKYRFLVIHDFAYGNTCFDGYRAPSFLQVEGAKDVGCESFTMSKGWNMAGWRIGFLVGNKDMVECLAKIKGYYDYGVFQAIQIATIIALRECGGEMEKQAKVYESRRDVLVEGLNRGGWNVAPPKASMFVWAPVPEACAQMGSIDFCMKLLEEAEVAVAPGRGFGEEGEGYVRLALVENENRLRQAIKQIRRVCPVTAAEKVEGE